MPPPVTKPAVPLPSVTGAVALLRFLEENGDMAPLEIVETFARKNLRSDISETDCKTDDGLAAKLRTFPFIEVDSSPSGCVVKLVGEMSRIGFSPEHYKRVENKMIAETQLLYRSDNIFMCATCAKYVANKPIVSPCGHISCKQCVENCLSEERGICFYPRCERELLLSECFNISRRSTGVFLELWELLASILVKCDKEDCNWKGRYDCYMLHAAVCPYHMGYTKFPFAMRDKDVTSTMDSLERERKAHKILSTLEDTIGA